MRYSLVAFALLAAPLLAPSRLCAAAPPNFSGTWELDPAKSPDANGATITLTIEDGSGKITLQRSVHSKDGKEITSHFTCSPGGAECEYNDNGHKAKVSLWYNGPSLMILKTDGPKEDSTTQWKFELGPDGKILNVHCEHVEPAAKEEDNVFTKKT